MKLLKLLLDLAILAACLLAGIYYLLLEMTKAMFNAVLVGPREGNA
jgi:hypothetical protein